MRYRHRLVEQKVAELFQHFPAVAVVGARQVGKTTLVENLFKDQISVTTFDPVVDVGGAREDPDFFLQNISTPAFLDEVQYAPELLGALKRRIDQEGKNSLFILSGSQNLSVLKNISESLAGRVAIIQLLPMAHREIREDLSHGFLEKWLSSPKTDIQTHSANDSEPVFHWIWRGTYPKIMELPDNLIPHFWHSYLQTYIERDVRTVANIGSLQTYGSFIGLLAALTAQEINFNQLGRELGISRKTAMAWTEIAEATFQWTSIPAFSRNPVKKIAGKKKGFFTDTGFICYLQKISAPEVIGSHPMKGRLFETYVFMEILKNLQRLPMVPNLYHFRAYSGAEVDLILEFDGELFPIEIKAKTNPNRKDIRGFAALKNHFPHENFHKGLLICSIPKPTPLSEDCLAIPWWMI